MRTLGRMWWSAKQLADSPEVVQEFGALPHTTSVKNRFRRADFCQLLLKEKPYLDNRRKYMHIENHKEEVHILTPVV